MANHPNNLSKSFVSGSVQIIKSGNLKQLDTELIRYLNKTNINNYFYVNVDVCHSLSKIIINPSLGKYRVFYKQSLAPRDESYNEFPDDGIELKHYHVCMGDSDDCGIFEVPKDIRCRLLGEFFIKCDDSYGASKTIQNLYEPHEMLLPCKLMIMFLDNRNVETSISLSEQKLIGDIKKNQENKDMLQIYTLHRNPVIFDIFNNSRFKYAE